MGSHTPQATIPGAWAASARGRPGIWGRVEPYITITWQPGRSDCRRGWNCAPADKPNQRGSGRWWSEVGGVHMSEDVW